MDQNQHNQFKGRSMKSQALRPPRRELTVYETLPANLAGYDYYSWTKEWLPRLAGSRAGKRKPTAITRNPVGFAIQVKHPNSSTPSNKDINPTVLHFGGSSIKYREEGIGQRSADETKEVKTKPLRRTYTKSPFRKLDTLEERDDEYGSDAQNNTPSGYAVLPSRSHSGSDFIESAENGRMKSGASKYVVLSHNLTCRNGAPSPSATPGTRNVAGQIGDSNLQLLKLREAQVDAFGLISPRAAQTSNHFAIPGKGNLHLGHSWRLSDGRAWSDGPDFSVTNTSKGRSVQTEKVKLRNVLENV